MHLVFSSLDQSKVSFISGVPERETKQACVCIGSSVIADARNYHAARLMSIGVPATMRYLYPRMTAIHDLSPDVGFPSPATGRLVLPSPMPSSYTHMEPDGVYLIGAAGIFHIRGT
jgi:hypothetical protein